MPYCDDCGRHVTGADAGRGMMDDAGRCWRCSPDIDARGTH